MEGEDGWDVRIKQVILEIFFFLESEKMGGGVAKI